MSPTQLTAKELRKNWQATFQIVEHYNRFAKRRIDLFGVIDILALIGKNIVGIQTCTAKHHAARRKKIIAEPRITHWLRAGGLMEIWSWSKQGARGKRKTWTLRHEAITLEDFANAK